MCIRDRSSRYGTAAPALADYLGRMRRLEMGIRLSSHQGLMATSRGGDADAASEGTEDLAPIDPNDPSTFLGPEEADALLGETARRSLKADAISLEHQLTHKPKNP